MGPRQDPAPGTFGEPLPAECGPIAAHPGAVQAGEDEREELRRTKESAGLAPGATPGAPADRTSGAAKDAARRAGEAGSQAASQAASAAKEQAADLARQAKEQGRALLDEQKERAATMAEDVASAVRQAAEKLRQEGDQNLAGYADALADGAGSVARYARRTEPGEMCRHVGMLARRHPEWVLGGAYVAGLAIARFLKAQRPDGASSGDRSYLTRRRDGGIGQGSPAGGAGTSARARSFETTGGMPSAATGKPSAAGGAISSRPPRGETAADTTSAFHPPPEVH